MNLDVQPLVNEALRRSGVSIEALSDAKQIAAIDWKNEFPRLSGDDLATVSSIPPEGTYETVSGSVTSVVSYANGSWDDGLNAVVEDCDYPPMAKFMLAVVDILIENPTTFPELTLDPTKLAEIRQAIPV